MPQIARMLFFFYPRHPCNRRPSLFADRQARLKTKTGLSFLKDTIFDGSKWPPRDCEGRPYHTAMKQTIELSLPPEVAFDEIRLEQEIRSGLRIPSGNPASIRQTRRSIDARGRQVKVNISAEVYLNEPLPPLLSFQKTYPDVSRSPAAIIVGCGPAGMFAALRLIECGIKPVVLERGRDVRGRRRDLAAITKNHVVNPDSNYCFGEGGAGTYSDGKLYTRSKKRGDVRRILEILVTHGATEEILVEAHPHIGTNKLPQVVTALRESILNAGGEIHFDTRIVDFVLINGEMRGVVTASGDTIEGIGVILATGHSARDIFELLHAKNILIEAKPFAMGVRIEHPQEFIDSVQYHFKTPLPHWGGGGAGNGVLPLTRSHHLPAASYSLVAQAKFKGAEKGVFSFCMCPGGYIVPSATAPGEIVVNGMSPSRRDGKFANSGMVVSVDESDWQPYTRFGVLAGLELQKTLEQNAFRAAGGTQAAPAQKLMDFVHDKVSTALLPTSYQPGLVAIRMGEILPPPIAVRLREGLQAFGSQMRGYLTNEAQMVGVESRTSSPVRIPRDKETLEHVQVGRLFPCGEGAGYAGGIVSAAMDGERCAENLAAKYVKG